MKKLLFLTFLIGFSSLAGEILAIRSLSVVSGSSSIVVSNIISVVILSMSFGYFISGKVEKSQKNLSIGIFVSSLFFIIAPISILFLKIIASVLINDLSLTFFIFLFASSILGSFFIAGIPAMSLGFSSPIVFAMLQDEIKSSQITASKSFLWSGIGSLFGSLLPNLFLIPFLGTDLSFILIGLINLLFFFFAFEKFSDKKFFLLVILTIFSIVLPKNFTKASVIKSFETEYQTIEVREDENGMKFLGINLGLGYQSIFDPDSKFLNKFYFDNPLIFLNKNIGSKDFKVLILGSAGETVSSYIQKYYGKVYENLEITNVDIDPKMHKIAEEFFNSSGTKFVSSDARIFLDFTKEKYDLVVVDLYSNEFYIPSTALTKEFFQKISKVLTPEGVVTFNLNAVSEDSKITKVVVGSMQKNFDFVYISPDSEKPNQINNFLITASNSKINFKNLCEEIPFSDLDIENECKRIAKFARVAKKSDMVGKDSNISSEFLTAELIFDL